MNFSYLMKPQGSSKTMMVEDNKQIIHMRLELEIQRIPIKAKMETISPFGVWHYPSILSIDTSCIFFQEN